MIQKSQAQEMFNQLRKQADALMRARGGSDDSIRFADNPMQLIHELQTLQIELELQNEELHCSQQRFMEATKRYAELYDFAPVGYITVDLRGVILNANLTFAKMLLIERMDLIDQLLSEYILFEDQDIYYLHQKALVDSKIGAVCELRMQKNDGKIVNVKLESSRILDGYGKACKFRIITHNISKHKQANEGLRESNEVSENPISTKNEFLNKIAHEIRTPINTILEMNRLAFKSAHDPEQRRYLEKAMDSAESILSLIKGA